MTAQAALKTDVNIADTAAVRRTREEARRLSGRIVVGGNLTTAGAEATFPVENPADESEIGFAPRCGQPDGERAVTAAHRAFRSWSRISARERGNILRKVADALETRSEELARLLCLETGNALSTQARPEIDSMLEILSLFAGGFDALDEGERAREIAGPDRGGEAEISVVRLREASQGIVRPLSSAATASCRSTSTSRHAQPSPMAVSK